MADLEHVNVPVAVRVGVGDNEAVDVGVLETVGVCVWVDEVV